MYLHIPLDILSSLNDLANISQSRIVFLSLFRSLDMTVAIGALQDLKCLEDNG